MCNFGRAWYQTSKEIVLLHPREYNKAGAHGTAGTVLAVPLFEQRGGRGTLSKLCGASNGHE